MYPSIAIFDIAGTTVNDFGLVQKTLIKIFKDFTGIEIPLSYANEIMGIPKDIAFRQLCSEFHKAESEENIQLLVGNFETELCHTYNQPGALEPMPFATELFNILHSERCLVYLDTGFSRTVTDVIIKNLDWGSQIDGSIASNEVSKGRPEPDMIFEALKRARISNPAITAKIGDTKSDLFEGHNAGCRWVIGVCTGAYSRSELELYPHTHIVNNLFEIIDIFK